MRQLQCKEGIRKRVRPRRRWSDKIGGDLTIIRIKNRQAIARDRRECRTIVLESMVHNGLQRLRRRGRRRRRIKF